VSCRASLSRSAMLEASLRVERRLRLVRSVFSKVTRSKISSLRCLTSSFIRES
jgi:hypothetical protein